MAGHDCATSGSATLHDMPVGCTPEVRAAVEALRGVARDSNVAMMVVFGSQARGDARSDSDLDMLYVMRHSDPFDEIDEAIKQSGVHSTIIPHTAASLKREMNLYGRMEYWAMREGVVIHDGTRAGSILRHVVRHDSDSVRACAPRWMRVARSYFTSIKAYERRGGRDNGFRCYMSYFAAASAIKAILTHNGVLFPFTRTLRPLYEMLPDRSIVDDVCGLDTVQSWERRPSDRDNRTRSEALEASKLAKIIYVNADKSMHGKME